MFYHTLLFFVHFFTYWFMSFVFLIYDVAYRRVKGSNYEYLSLVVLENQLFVSLPFVLFFDTYFPFEKELSVIHIGWQVPCLLILHEIFFYHLHRLMHTKYLYKYHKQHHQIRKLVGVGALYSGKVDHFLVNMLPVYLPPFLLNMNYLLILIWIIIATINTICIHSSYDYFDKRHEHHHVYLNVNYGIGFYVIDRLYGTYKP